MSEAQPAATEETPRHVPPGEFPRIREFLRDNPFIHYGAPWRRGPLLRMMWWGAGFLLLLLFLSQFPGGRALIRYSMVPPLKPPFFDDDSFAGLRIFLSIITAVFAAPLIQYIFTDRRMMLYNSEELRLLPRSPEYIAWAPAFWGFIGSLAFTFVGFSGFNKALESLARMNSRGGWGEYAVFMAMMTFACAVSLAGATRLVLLATRWVAVRILAHMFFLLPVLMGTIFLGAALNSDMMDEPFGALMFFGPLSVFVTISALHSLRELTVPSFFRLSDPEWYQRVSWWGRDSAKDFDAGEWQRAKATLRSRYLMHFLYGFLGLELVLVPLILFRVEALLESGMLFLIPLLAAAPVATLMLRYHFSRGRLQVPIVPGRLLRSICLFVAPVLVGIVAGIVTTACVAWRMDSNRWDFEEELTAAAICAVAIAAVATLALIPGKGRRYILLGIVAFILLGLIPHEFAKALWAGCAVYPALGFVTGLPNMLLQRIHRLEVLEREGGT